MASKMTVYSYLSILCAAEYASSVIDYNYWLCGRTLTSTNNVHLRQSRVCMLPYTLPGPRVVSVVVLQQLGES